MKKLILILMFITAGYISANEYITMADTNATRISKQDSLPTYNATDIFVMQRKVGGIYRWRKMYMPQLINILNDSLNISNLMIPRLSGMPTTHLSLLTFALNTLYRADFNYNFKKLDSLSIAFNLNDFVITGDTVSIVSQPSLAYGGLFHDYASSHLYVPLVGSAFATLKGMTLYNVHNVTTTDSSLIIQKAGIYLYSISAAIEDTTSGSVFAGLFLNGTRVPVVSTILPTSSTSQRVTFALNSNLILHVGDILLFKFQGTVPHNEIIIWNVNIMVQKL